MRDKKGIFENEIEEISTDHMIDCHMIFRDGEEDTDEEAMGTTMTFKLLYAKMASA